MNIGIIGSGEVGQTLGKAFILQGYNVMIGSRSPKSEKLKGWKDQTGKKGETGTFFDAAKFGEPIVLAVLGSSVKEAIELANPQNLEGKIIMDITNPLDFSKGMPPLLFTGGTDSLGERIQKMVPKSKIVKVLNHVPNSLMYNPNLNGLKPTAFICGNDKDAIKVVIDILSSFGWDDIIDIGDIIGARYQETLVALWVRISAKLGSYNTSFKIIRG